MKIFSRQRNWWPYKQRLKGGAFKKKTFAMVALKKLFWRGLLLSTFLLGIFLFRFTFKLSSNAGREDEIHLTDVIREIPTDELLCDPASTPDIRAMSKSGYRAYLRAAEVNSTDNFTVLMLTYDRFKSFRQVATHYACMPFVDRVILLWANQEVAAPELKSFETPCRDKIIVKHLQSKGITLRFASFPEIRTEGVLNVDDDFLPTEPYLLRAFRIWKDHSWLLVGPNTRSHQGTDSKTMEYVGSWQKGYSVILTSYAFIHREYLRLFDEKIPTEIREQIDSNKNCEDIFINFLVKQHCRCSGAAKIHPESITFPRFVNFQKSLSSRPKHYIYRAQCLRNYTEHFGDSVNLTVSRCVY